jgi:Peptidase MA superfamily
MLSLPGCTTIKSVFAMAKSTDDFISLEENPVVKYEEGAVEFARKISPHINPAIHSIEFNQGLFPDNVSVYAPKSIDNFASFCTSEAPAACVVGKRLFVSPKLSEQQERIPRVLTHELSHLQLTQYLGRWDYHTKLPAWFKEGLAVYVSEGAGAEKVSEQKALEAIKQGNTIRPNGSGSLLFMKTASSFGLKPHMFYRQSAMYVKWLHDLDNDKFHKLFDHLHKGNTLNEALISVYGFDASAGWESFVGDIEHNNSVNSDWRKHRSLSVALLPPARYMLRQVN